HEMSSPSGPGAPDLARRWLLLLQQDEQPDLSAFLASAGDLTVMQVAAVLRADQQAHWQAGDRVPAEAYLESHPIVQADIEGAVDLIYGEFLLRERLGEAPRLQEFLERFPACAGRLRQQVDFHRALEEPQPTESVDLWKTVGGPQTSEAARKVTPHPRSL